MNVLLHICCAPCAIYPIRALREEGHQVTGFFYNPNIHPYYEYRKRLDTLINYAETVDLELKYDDDYPLEDFLRIVAYRESLRCEPCYHLRLSRTARFARRERFDCFTSTLFYSKFQQHETMKILAESLAHETDGIFLYQDFRPGWKEGVDASRSLGMYRQHYCGCLYSERERYMGKSRGQPPRNPLGEK